jgi:hypothetical protein
VVNKSRVPTALDEHNKLDNLAPPMVDNGIASDPDYKGKGLELELTVEDEGAFTSPWSASMIYWPPLVPMGTWPEITCVEGAKDYNGRNFAKKALMPVADNSTFEHHGLYSLLPLSVGFLLPLHVALGRTLLSA